MMERRREKKTRRKELSGGDEEKKSTNFVKSKSEGFGSTQHKSKFMG